MEATPKKRSKQHPAPFPNEIPNRLIQLYTWEEDTVYDPFGGEGTTALESMRLNRKAIISESNQGILQRDKENDCRFPRAVKVRSNTFGKPCKVLNWCFGRLLYFGFARVRINWE